MARQPKTTPVSDNSTSARARTAAALEANPAQRVRRVRGELRDEIARDIPKALTVIRKAMGAAPLAANEIAPTDTQIAMAKLVIDHVLPPLRPVSKPTKFKLSPGADLPTLCEEIMIAVSKGRLDPAVAKDLISALTKVYQVVEVEQVRAEMAELRRALLKDE